MDNELDKRLDRELENREKTTRTKQWVRSTLLPDPLPQDGYDFRWVRISNNGQSDPTNFSSKIREGWEPVMAKDHPEIPLVGIENERYADNVVMGGVILCKAPTELVEQRNSFFQQQAENQMTAVDNNLMRESNSKMPLFNNRKSDVTFGKGN